MRDFTPEEKELILNTHISINTFELDSLRLGTPFEDYVELLEASRIKLKMNRKHPRFDDVFKAFVGAIPNSYKVVKLC